MQANWQQRVVFAIVPWAFAEIIVSEFFIHLLQSSRCQNVASVNQAIESPCKSFKIFSLGVRAFLLKLVCDDVHHWADTWNLGFQAREVEPVQNELWVDIAKVFISFCSQKPVNPEIFQGTTKKKVLALDQICHVKGVDNGGKIPENSESDIV